MNRHHPHPRAHPPPPSAAKRRFRTRLSTSLVDLTHPQAETRREGGGAKAAHGDRNTPLPSTAAPRTPTSPSEPQLIQRPRIRPPHKSHQQNNRTAPPRFSPAQTHPDPSTAATPLPSRPLKAEPGGALQLDPVLCETDAATSVDILSSCPARSLPPSSPVVSSPSFPCVQNLHPSTHTPLHHQPQRSAFAPRYHTTPHLVPSGPAPVSLVPGPATWPPLRPRHPRRRRRPRHRPNAHYRSPTPPFASFSLQSN